MELTLQVTPSQASDDRQVPVGDTFAFVRKDISLASITNVPKTHQLKVCDPNLLLDLLSDFKLQERSNFSSFNKR